MDTKILWADDEIDLLKPQILFLEQKGYKISAVSNGYDAIDKCNEEDFDLVFLDENMPGISGLETLSKIKFLHNDLPVVMITKSEEENIMEEAIGSQIADYLIKPVRPNQVLLSIKKIIDNKRLVSEKTSVSYRQQFQQIMMELNDDLDAEAWAELYKKLIYWDLELDKSSNTDMLDVFEMQKVEANKEFYKYIQKNYTKWLQKPDAGTPAQSHTLIKKKVLPILDNDVPTFFILIDNLRYDHYKMLEPILKERFKKVSEDFFYSILPTTTQYSRNAIFSGLMPSEINKKYPDKWFFDDENEGKNLHEAFFLEEQLKRNGLNIKSSYTKITNHKDGKELEDNILNMMHNQFNAIVYNFVDMLSHVRTEMEVLKEIANDEAAYRSLTLSWFEHSPLLSALEKLQGKKARIVITSDHGTTRVKTPSKVVGDKNTTTNLRYKTGKNLNFNPKEVFEVKNPDEAFLPKSNVSSSYIFAKEDYYFCYPNNYNYFVNFFRNTFQHGGISLEEVIVPVAIFETK
ncbi:MAG TPA: PglZ domain-containing protein [Chitinophagales bacterium]|nr:bifunctional response regulator/alkaline phosphatase family protein [Chitinophagales bacterium]MCB9074953.1 PglZ domain-containing protein [Chitinophagales bacterium]HMU98250.1 PglZ domain-containing protein [Chitinophagales bacterium]HMV01753.1 PglZ domain-containing protein [Chitinophagales bacterium]HMW94739.1 PglZ domain-containing protein [Chitinophagales bacterium]